MTHTPHIEHLIVELAKLHAEEAALNTFGPFPKFPRPQPCAPHVTPATRLFLAETHLNAERYETLHKAVIAAAPYFSWREYYKDTVLGAEFSDRFGSFCIIGPGGLYHADTLQAYMVYMPAGLYYPFHHHPAEEIYFILAGQAQFRIADAPLRTLHPGDHVYHPSNVPHATETTSHPVLALVYWRGDMTVPPVLTNPNGHS